MVNANIDYTDDACLINCNMSANCLSASFIYHSLKRYYFGHTLGCKRSWLFNWNRGLRRTGICQSARPRAAAKLKREDIASVGAVDVNENRRNVLAEQV